MVLSSADSSSWSSAWFLGGTTSSQLLTSCMFWLTSHTFPEFTSFRTTRSRFTRKTYDGEALALGTCHVLVVTRRSTQSRTYLFAPDHAAWTQPPSCTGAAGTPSPPNVTVFAVEPSSGCFSSAFCVATATASDAGPGCCSFASRASASATSRPPGRNSLPAAASRTTGWSPTTASCRSPAPFSPSQVLDSVAVGSPSASTAVTVTCAGLRIRRIDPVIGADGGHQALRARQGRLAGFLVEGVDRRRRHRPHLAGGGVRDGDDLGAEADLRRARAAACPRRAACWRRKPGSGWSRIRHRRRPCRRSAGRRRWCWPGVTAPSSTREG